MYLDPVGPVRRRGSSAEMTLGREVIDAGTHFDAARSVTIEIDSIGHGRDEHIWT